MTTNMTTKNVSRMYYPLNRSSAGCFSGRYNWAVTKLEDGKLYGAQMNKRSGVTAWSNRKGAEAFLEHVQPFAWFPLVESLEDAKALSAKL